MSVGNGLIYVPKGVNDIYKIECGVIANDQHVLRHHYSHV